jgi:hypothetical protein
MHSNDVLESPIIKGQQSFCYELMRQRSYLPRVQGRQSSGSRQPRPTFQLFRDKEAHRILFNVFIHSCFTIANVNAALNILGALCEYRNEDASSFRPTT